MLTIIWPFVYFVIILAAGAGALHLTGNPIAGVVAVILAGLFVPHKVEVVDE